MPYGVEVRSASRHFARKPSDASCAGNPEVSGSRNVTKSSIIILEPQQSDYADVVKLVYTHALGAGAVRREGSSPFIRTRLNLQKNRPFWGGFLIQSSTF